MKHILCVQWPSIGREIDPRKHQITKNCRVPQQFNFVQRIVLNHDLNAIEQRIEDALIDHPNDECKFVLCFIFDELMVCSGYAP